MKRVIVFLLCLLTICSGLVVGTSCKKQQEDKVKIVDIKLTDENYAIANGDDVLYITDDRSNITFNHFKLYEDEWALSFIWYIK